MKLEYSKGRCYFITVIRRIGGLENKDIVIGPICTVIRRIGGLESTDHLERLVGNVIRRIGGLEIFRKLHKRFMRVIRRIGGLEMKPRKTFIDFLSYPPYRRLRK